MGFSEDTIRSRRTFSTADSPMPKMWMFHAEYYTPHAIATIMARLLVGDNYAVIRNILKNTRSLRPDDWDTEISPKKLSCVGGGSALEMCKGRLRIKVA